ncbi:hypothetical protein EVAR_9472_1 [Eumeta japonica]|uniref:Uncharacterized protein n=1 Tax=Eumeta variegata TaxID=151549 RepID=A0A4C1UEH3_EUMVA|nr:hypothetical protein EVAR_9472_1 [Eumeta japonica]
MFRLVSDSSGPHPSPHSPIHHPTPLSTTPLQFHQSILSSINILFLTKKLTKQFTLRLCAAAVSFLLGRIGRCSGREIDESQADAWADSASLLLRFLVCTLGSGRT